MFSLRRLRDSLTGSTRRKSQSEAGIYGSGMPENALGEGDALESADAPGKYGKKLKRKMPVTAVPGPALAAASKKAAKLSERASELVVHYGMHEDRGDVTHDAGPREEEGGGRTWTRKSVRAHWCAQRDLRLVTATWNVNGRVPDEGTCLKGLLGIDMGQDTVMPDVVAFTMQEAVPLTAGNVFADVVVGGSAMQLKQQLLLLEKQSGGDDDLRTKEQRRADLSDDTDATSADGTQNARGETEQPGDEDGDASLSADIRKWHHLIRDTLNSPDTGAEEYVCVARRQMVGVYLTVWVRASLTKLVQNVSTTTVGTGVMGLLGNKGGVACRLCIGESAIAFIGCHLASGDGVVDRLRRHSNMKEIWERAVFDVSASVGTGDEPTTSLYKEHSLAQCDCAIWMGDMNFRCKLDDAHMAMAARDGVIDFHELLLSDELSHELAAAAAAASGAAVSSSSSKSEVYTGVLAGWKEPPIRFAPTYKVRCIRSIMCIHALCVCFCVCAQAILESMTDEVNATFSY